MALALLDPTADQTSALQARQPAFEGGCLDLSQKDLQVISVGHVLPNRGQAAIPGKTDQGHPRALTVEVSAQENTGQFGIKRPASCGVDRHIKPRNLKAVLKRIGLIPCLPAKIPRQKPAAQHEERGAEFAKTLPAGTEQTAPQRKF